MAQQILALGPLAASNLPPPLAWWLIWRQRMARLLSHICRLVPTFAAWTAMVWQRYCLLLVRRQRVHPPPSCCEGLVAVSCCGERARHQKGQGAVNQMDQSGNEARDWIWLAYQGLKLLRHSNPERALPRIELVRSNGCNKRKPETNNRGLSDVRVGWGCKLRICNLVSLHNT